MSGKSGYTKEKVREQIKYTNKNKNLIVKDIRTTKKKTLICLECNIDDFKEDVPTDKYNEKLKKDEYICRICKKREKQKIAEIEFRENGFTPFDDKEMDKYENLSSIIKCYDTNMYIVNTSLKYLRKVDYSSKNIIFCQPPRYNEDLTYNLRLLCEKVGLRFDGKYEGASKIYTGVKYGKYKVRFTIGQVQEVLKESKGKDIDITYRFDEFAKNNKDHIMDNIRVYLLEDGIQLLSDKIEYRNGRRYLDVSFYKEIEIEGRKVDIEFEAIMDFNDYRTNKILPSISYYRDDKYSKEKNYFIKNMQKIIDAKGLNYELIEAYNIEDRNGKVRTKLSAYKDKLEKIFKVTIDRDEIMRKDRISVSKVFDKSNKHVIENINKYCKIYRPDYTLVSTEYKNARENLKWKYIGERELKSTSKKEFLMTWDNFSSGRNPEIFTKSMAETILLEALEDIGLSPKTQVKLEGCKSEDFLKFDAVIFKDDYKLSYSNIVKKEDFDMILLIIEYQGIYHFEDIRGQLEDQIKRDNIKVEFCKNYGINLSHLNQTPYAEISQETKLILDKYSINYDI